MTAFRLIVLLAVVLPASAHPGHEHAGDEIVHFLSDPASLIVTGLLLLLAVVLWRRAAKQR